MIRLDIGGGSTPKEGFENIDLLTGHDVVEDGIPYDDSSVDEIYSSHFLEHLSQMPPYEEVQKVISEMHRALVFRGKATIIVPNILWICQNFINTSEHERWGWTHATIFGAQTNDGEFHKSGFTASRLQTLFRQGGFVTASIDENFWDERHKQGSILAEFTSS